MGGGQYLKSASILIFLFAWSTHGYGKPRHTESGSVSQETTNNFLEETEGVDQDVILRRFEESREIAKLLDVPFNQKFIDKTFDFFSERGILTDDPNVSREDIADFLKEVGGKKPTEELIRIGEAFVRGEKDKFEKEEKEKSGGEKGRDEIGSKPGDGNPSNIPINLKNEIAVNESASKGGSGGSGNGAFGSPNVSQGGGGGGDSPPIPSSLQNQLVGVPSSSSSPFPMTSPSSGGSSKVEAFNDPFSRRKKDLSPSSEVSPSRSSGESIRSSEAGERSVSPPPMRVMITTTGDKTTPVANVVPPIAGVAQNGKEAAAAEGTTPMPIGGNLAQGANSTLPVTPVILGELPEKADVPPIFGSSSGGSEKSESSGGSYEVASTSKKSGPKGLLELIRAFLGMGFSSGPAKEENMLVSGELATSPSSLVTPEIERIPAAAEFSFLPSFDSDDFVSFMQSENSWIYGSGVLLLIAACAFVPYYWRKKK